MLSVMPLNMMADLPFTKRIFDLPPLSPSLSGVCACESHDHISIVFLSALLLVLSLFTLPPIPPGIVLPALIRCDFGCILLPR